MPSSNGSNGSNGTRGSHTSQGQGGSQRRRIDAATASAEELLTHLAVDPARGLSPKEAERRLAKSTAKPLFSTPAPSYLSCLGRTLREPALWLLLAVGIIALFFSRIPLGLVCVLLTVGHALLCAYLQYRTERIDTAMAAYDTPLSRVLRGGRVCRVGAEGLVRGDILLLHQGDIVPADCRLLRAHSFVVSERELDATDPDRAPVRLEKDAAFIPMAGGGYRVSPPNMAYAGGLVEEGFALAVVIATGSQTHLGGLVGHIPSGRRGRIPTFFAGSRKYLSWYNLAMLFLVLPLTALGILTLQDEYELLDIFLSPLALAALTMTEHLLIKGLYIASMTRRAAAVDRDADSTAEIKTAADLEKLTAMTDLFLVGTAALHDGGCHPEMLYVGRTPYRCDSPDSDEYAHAAVEALYLYYHGVCSFPAAAPENEDFLDCIPTLCDWAEVDTDALRVKATELRGEEGAVSFVLPTPEGNHRVALSMTEHSDEALACDRLDMGGRAVTPDSADAESMTRMWKDIRKKGFRLMFLISTSDRVTTLVAAVAYGPAAGRKTAGLIKSFEHAGIRVAAFLPEVSSIHTRVLSACGLTENHPASRPDKNGAPRPSATEELNRGIRAFEGCSDEFVLTAMRDLQAQGRTVGVLSVDARDLPLLTAADVAFTCSPSCYASAEEGIIRPARGSSALPANLPDGLPDSPIANDRTRRAARVVVRRSSESGGGIAGVRRALLAADACKSALDRSLRFVFVSQALRLLMTVTPLCLSLAPAAAPALLLSGLCVDLAVVFTALGLPLRHEPAHRRSLDRGLKTPWITWLPDLIGAAAATLIPWIIVGIANLLSVNFGGDLSYFGLICTVATQVAILRAHRLPAHNRAAFFGTLALVLAYIFAVALALGAGLSFIWVILIPPVAPAAYLAARAIAKLILRATGKGDHHGDHGAHHGHHHSEHER